MLINAHLTNAEVHVERQENEAVRSYAAALLTRSETRVSEQRKHPLWDALRIVLSFLPKAGIWFENSSSRPAACAQTPHSSWSTGSAHSFNGTGLGPSPTHTAELSD